MTVLRRLKIAAGGFLLCLLTGCSVGPAYTRPEVPAAESYTATSLPGETVSASGVGGAAQRFVPDRDIPGQWWELFRSKPLDEVIGRALADSPTLAAAQAALREAQENLRAEAGSSLFPQLDAGGSAVRQRSEGDYLNLFNASVSLAYSPDLFGGVRRGLEALHAQVDYRRFQIEGAYITLTANIVTTAVKEASLRAQIMAMDEIVAAEEKQLALVKDQLRLGGVSRADVLAHAAQLAQTRAALPSLEKELEQTRHQLAVLAGRQPGKASSLPEFRLEGFSLPPEIPVSLPSSLARQRPDIRAAEALLQAACAQVGVATANLYPRISLSGEYELESAKLSHLFNGDSALWSLAGGLFQPLFRGGELTAKRRAAVAAYDQAAAQYRETILLAFQNVADTLRAVEADARALRAQAEAEAAARESLELTEKQFRLGSVSYLSLLNAQRQHQQALIGLVQARAVRFADTAALFQALGGGWWNRVPQADEAAGTEKIPSNRRRSS